MPDDKLVLIQHYSWPCPSLPYTAKTMKRRLSACLEFGVLLLYPETTSLQPGTVSSVSPKQTSGSKTGAVPSAADTHPSSSSPEQTLVLILRVRRVCMRKLHCAQFKLPRSGKRARPRCEEALRSRARSKHGHQDIGTHAEVSTERTEKMADLERSEVS